MPIIEVDSLTRSFTYHEKPEGLTGSVRSFVRRTTKIREAVKGITFAVNEGEVVGFLGPNGAGKTTTLKMLAGIMHPSAGTARVMGAIPWQRKKAFRMRIAIVLGQRSQLWPDLPARESFQLNRAIYEIPKPDYERRLGELVEMFDLKDLLAVQVRRLSLGERMKMDIVAALLHKPSVLFLDEPTIGLDLLSQRAIQELVRTLNREEHVTVMLTSHYLSDIETLCERVVLINDGSLVYDGPLAGVNATLSERKTITLVLSAPVPPESLARYDGFRGVEGLTVRFEVPRGAVRSFSRQALDELPVIDLTIEEIPLEEGIAALYRGDASRGRP
jgi:ABC-2 type transport system ATP-binding protein